MSQKITTINEEQQSDLEEWLELGMNVMAHYGVNQELSVYENLDSVYAAWAEDKGSKPSADEVIIGLGTVFGDRLGQKHDTPWQLVCDEHGTDFMMQIKGYQIYPMDFVAKRIGTLDSSEPEFGFFGGMDAVIDGWE